MERKDTETQPLGHPITWIFGRTNFWTDKGMVEDKTIDESFQGHLRLRVRHDGGHLNSHTETPNARWFTKAEMNKLLHVEQKDINNV